MFKVGQKVVCIETHNLGHFKKGEIFILSGIKQCPNCKKILLDIGITVNYDIIVCGKCGLEKENDNYFSSHRFKPLYETFADEVLENIKEQIEQEELVYV